MSIIDTLIFDRTKADADRWAYLEAKPFVSMTAEEKSEWLAGPKGAYNPAKDLNRVGTAILYLANRLSSYGYAVPVSPKTNWAMTDEPTLAQLEAYLKDVGTVRGVLELLPTSPQAPADMQGLTWQEANDIEKILVDVETVINRVVKAFRRSGAFSVQSGNQPLPSAETNYGRTWAEFDAMQFTWEDLEQANWYLWAYGNPRKETT